MKEIKLTKGAVSLVDDEDFDELNSYKWYLNTTGYAERSIWKPRRNITLHRFLLNPDKGMEVDHINRDKLDNQKINLRISTPGQNKFNRLKLKTNTTNYKGVYFDKANKKYRAAISINGKQSQLGRFNTAEEAFIVYLKVAKELQGEYFPEEFNDFYLKNCV